MKPPKQPPNTQDKSVDKLGEILWKVSNLHNHSANYTTEIMGVDVAKQELLQLLLSALPEKAIYQCICGVFYPKATGYCDCGAFIANTPKNTPEVDAFNQSTDLSVSEIKRLFNGGL